MQNAYQISRMLEVVAIGDRLLLDGQRVVVVCRVRDRASGLYTKIVVRGSRGGSRHIKYDFNSGLYCAITIGRKTEIKRTIKILEKEL